MTKIVYYNFKKCYSNTLIFIIDCLPPAFTQPAIEIEWIAIECSE